MRTLDRPADRDALVRRIRSLTPATPRLWGTMSPHQMLCHLADTLRVSLDERRATAVGNPVAHTLVKLLVLYAPVPIPRDRPTTPELDQTRSGTPPGEFVDDLRTLELLLDRFAAEPRPIDIEHPFFGPLSHREWGRFHYRHIDHHLRQFGA